MELAQLRQQHPRFIYESYDSEITAAGVELRFVFHLEPDITFRPTITLEGMTTEQWEAWPQTWRNRWVFHLGMMEIPSYWKSSCAPEIVIRADHLSQAQLDWWQRLLLHGMGEFFYVNQIDFTAPNFVHWQVEHDQERALPDTTQAPTIPNNTKYLLPLGGGKDSALAGCLLNQEKIAYGIFLLNPTAAATAVTTQLQPTESISVRRVIDPTLLQLNQQGYLNGHVPFSANLAFISSLVAQLKGYQTVLISNERSSNEGNTEFHGQVMNHQYSKTMQFETDFIEYVRRYLSPDLSPAASLPYLSVLRPLYELQIAQLFARCPEFNQLLPIIRSCNRGQSQNSWCGHCPKCLFTFTALYPFVETEQLVNAFGKDLFSDSSLFPLAQEMLGASVAKPFECVGTYEETKIAFYLSIKRYQQTAGPALPPLLSQVQREVLTTELYLEERAGSLLKSWNDDHHLTPELERMLRHALARA